MPDERPIVYVVDDNVGVRRSIRLLMRSIGLQSEALSSAQEFLDSYDGDQPGCLVLDIRMPGMSGLELQEKLAAMGASIPIIFITAHGDVPMAVESLKAGAFDFIQKPFRDQKLIDSVQKALDADVSRRREMASRRETESKLAKLTKREREVMQLVVAGKPNKGIAQELNISERTVEIHRARVMMKMKAESLAALVRMALDQDS